MRASPDLDRLAGRHCLRHSGVLAADLAVPAGLLSLIAVMEPRMTGVMEPV